MRRIGIALGAFAVVGMATALVVEHGAQARLREQNQALRHRIAQLTQAGRERGPVATLAHSNLSAPTEQVSELLRLRGEFGVLRREKDEAGRLRAENDRMRSNWVEQVLGGKKLALEQVASFLDAKQRSAESLLAASRVTGDLALLREAIEKYPQDPRVNLTACFALQEGASSEERRQRWEAFKQSAPDNALANYLSAQEYFKSGQTDAAVRELLAASDKPKFDDYSGEVAEGVTEAYRAAGFSPVESAWAASAQPLPQLAGLKGLGQSLGELARQYQEAGDAASAQVALQMGVALGRRIGDPAEPLSLIQNLVGIAVERAALVAMDPASPYDGAGVTVKDRLDELARQRATIKEIAGDDVSWQTLPEPDQIAFFERMKASGELAALRWARTRQGKH